MTHKNTYPERHYFKTALADICVAIKLIQQFLQQALRATLDMRTLKPLYLNSIRIEEPSVNHLISWIKFGKISKLDQLILWSYK